MAPTAGKLDLFLGLITPHGLLELTAVFVAGGAGIRLGWQIIDPGPRPRSVALAEEGRAAVTIALGLVVVLSRVGRGRGVRDAVPAADLGPDRHRRWRVWIAFLAYVWVFGRAGVREGELGDVTGGRRHGATRP